MFTPTLPSAALLDRKARRLSGTRLPSSPCPAEVAAQLLQHEAHSDTYQAAGFLWIAVSSRREWMTGELEVVPAEDGGARPVAWLGQQQLTDAVEQGHWRGHGRALAEERALGQAVAEAEALHAATYEVRGGGYGRIVAPGLCGHCEDTGETLMRPVAQAELNGWALRVGLPMAMRCH